MESLLQEGVSEAGIRLQLKLVQVGVWAEDDAMPFSGRALAGGTLTGFCQWVSARRPPRDHPLHWHHAMLLTGWVTHTHSLSFIQSMKETKMLEKYLLTQGWRHSKQEGKKA